MLQDIPMPDQTIFNQTVNRRMVTSRLNFTELNFGANRLSFRVGIFHFKPQVVEVTIEKDGVSTTESRTIDQPLLDPRLPWTNGVIHYKIEVTDAHLVNVTTGRAAVEGDDPALVMGEFSYLRYALASNDLEDLLMLYLTRLVGEGDFDAGKYPVD